MEEGGTTESSERTERFVERAPTALKSRCRNPPKAHERTAARQNFRAYREYRAPSQDGESSTPRVRPRFRGRRTAERVLRTGPLFRSRTTHDAVSPRYSRVVGCAKTAADKTSPTATDRRGTAEGEHIDQDGDVWCRTSPRTPSPSRRTVSSPTVTTQSADAL